MSTGATVCDCSRAAAAMKRRACSATAAANCSYRRAIAGRPARSRQRRARRTRCRPTRISARPESSATKASRQKASTESRRAWPFAHVMARIVLLAYSRQTRRVRRYRLAEQRQRVVRAGVAVEAEEQHALPLAEAQPAVGERDLLGARAEQRDDETLALGRCREGQAARASPRSRGRSRTRAR